MRQRSLIPYVILSLGVLVVSTAAVLIRFAQQDGTPSLTIATGRLAFATLILTPLCWRRIAPEISALPRRTVFMGMVSGSFLAVHFASWIRSLEYTSVASSTALVATTPLWVGLASFWFFREPFRKTMAAAIGLTLMGSLLVGISDSQGDSGAQPLLGDALALLGSICGTGYLLIGREMRRHLSTLAYVWIAYTSAAAVLVVWLALSGEAILGFSPVTYLLILGLAIGPQLLGHTTLNWALRHLSATFVAVAILGEPIGSSLLAIAFLSESFAPLQLMGFVFLLAGIFVAAAQEKHGPPAEAAEIAH